MAEPTYEQVMTALANADKAGDTEAATQLAKMASTMSPQQQPAAAPTTMESLGRGAGLAGRALVTGASSIPNAVMDFMSGAYNLGAMGLDSESRAPMMSKLQQEALTKLGLPVASTLPEKISTGGIEAGAGGLTQAGIATASKVPALAAFAENIAPQVASQMGAGAAAQPAYEGIKNITGSDLAATIGSLGLSVVAGGLTGKATNKTLALADTAPKVTMDEVTQRASRAYTAMDNSGITVKPQSVLNMVAGVKTSINDANFIARNSPKIVNLLDDYESIVGTQRVPFSTIEKFRSMANNLKGDTDADTRRLAKIVVNNIDDYMANLNGKDVLSGTGSIDDAVKNVMAARKDWRIQSKANVLDDVLNRAEVSALNPTASESEKIRQGFINLLNNKSKISQFTSDEQAAIRKVAGGTPFDAVLSFVGNKLSPERSRLMGVGAAYGVGSGNALLPVLASLGYSADKVQQMLRSGAANNVIQGILNQSTKKPVSNYPMMGLLSAPIQQGQ